MVALLLATCITTHNLAYDRAQVHGPEDPDSVRGVLLILHGCDGTFPHDWWSFMVKQGFLTVSINSFDDPRPGAACHPPFSGVETIFALRHRQVSHTLEQLQAAYGGDLPILVWGYSEGGGVAQMIDEPVAGIITIGFRCGYRGQVRIRRDVPWLHLMGERDHYLVGKPHDCAGTVGRSDAWSYEVLPDQPHWPAFDSFRAPLVEFLTRTAP